MECFLCGKTDFKCGIHTHPICINCENKIERLMLEQAKKIWKIELNDLLDISYIENVPSNEIKYEAIKNSREDQVLNIAQEYLKNNIDYEEFIENLNVLSSEHK